MAGVGEVLVAQEVKEELMIPQEVLPELAATAARVLAEAAVGKVSPILALPEGMEGLGAGPGAAQPQICRVLTAATAASVGVGAAGVAPAQAEVAASGMVSGRLQRVRRRRRRRRSWVRRRNFRTTGHSESQGLLFR
jgi:hypothetical protein